MTRSSESRAQHGSGRGATNNASSSDNSPNNNNSNKDEREQASRQEDRGRSRHRRRSSSKRRNESSARAPSRGRGGGEEGDVLINFVKLLHQGAPQPDSAINGGSGMRIDLQKASNVLEAAAGNMGLAANLFWDDYFATQAANPPPGEAAEDPPSEPSARRLPDENDRDLDQKPAAEAAPRGTDRKRRERDQVGAHHPRFQRSIQMDDDDDDYPSRRRLRRSLDSDFRAADDDDETKKKKRAKKRARKSSNKNGPENNDEGDEDDQKMPAIRRNGDDAGMDVEVQARPPSRRRSHRRPQVDGDSEGSDNSLDDNDDEEEEDESNNKNRDRVRRHRAQRPNRIAGESRPVLAQVEGETTISVSDDELWREGHSKGGKPSSRPTDRNLARKLKKDVKVNRSAVLKAEEDIRYNLDRKGILSKTSTWFLSPEQKKKKRVRDDDDDSIDSNSEDYVCDDDWLGTEPYQIAMEFLWGAAHDYYTIDPEDNKEKEGGGANVVADEDAMNVSGEEEDGVENNKPAFKSVPLLIEGPEFRGIPYTWLSTGFQLSECGTGLVIKSPTVEEIEFFSWRQTQVNDKRNAVPPPYHCKSLTAITSIVTGLLYSGASIQGNEVNFTSGKKPWSSLTSEERKREFDSRLTDALSALIFVAAQASSKRKRKAYRKAMREEEPTDVEDNYSEILRKAIAVGKGPLAEMLKANEQLDGNSSSKENDDRDTTSSNTRNTSAVVEDNSSTRSKRRWKRALNQEEIQDPGYKEHVSMLMDKQDRELKERMRRRLVLIPTCVWADKKELVKPRSGDGSCFFSVDTKVKISWTNIRDIRLYVESNLRSFTDKGGIALFLETLLRIHGDNYIGRQLKRCAAATSSLSVTGKRAEEKDAHLIPEIGKRGEIICKGKPAAPFSVYAAGFPSLIRCTCEDRQRRMNEENPLPLNVRVDPTKLLDMTPEGTECVSVELLTLILTGRVSSDWKDCSSEKLGIGILTENVGEVSHGLARPQRPVWLIKGETCYTTLHIDGSWCSGNRNGSESTKETLWRDDLKIISRVDKPNASLNLCHWNGWYGQRNKTEMRLVTPNTTMEVPSRKLLAKFSGMSRGTNTKSLLMQNRRYEHAVNVVSAEEHKSNETKGKETLIRPGELDCISIHSEDQKLYPTNHKMWRFNLEDTSGNAMDKKSATQGWIPYFRLTPHQKRMVETKLGPKIKTILWTRWPKAIVDNFAPSDGEFPVV